MKKRIIIAIVIAILLSSLSLVNYLTKEPYDINKEINKCMEQDNANYRIHNKTVQCYITNTTTTKETTTTTKVNTTKKTTIRKTTKETQKAGSYKLTHYGADCKLCSGTTASGYNVKNTMYYTDKTYGNVRIVAMSSQMPLYSIIKIKNYKLGGDIYAIVLDRGVGSGVIDLLVESENKASKLGKQENIEIEILRSGR